MVNFFGVLQKDALELLLKYGLYVSSVIIDNIFFFFSVKQT